MLISRVEDFLPVVFDVLRLEALVFPSWSHEFVERAEYHQYEVQGVLFSFDDMKHALAPVIRLDQFESTRNAMARLEKSISDYGQKYCSELLEIFGKVELKDLNGSENFRKRIKQDFLHRHLQECIIPVPVLWTPEVKFLSPT
ncbi:MAG: hypothetical protein EOP04_25725 [Proteobacteria bacterium]|nr:MAG: hypothetical protein EOP04_25725 [Pseudomonadota bacterium]